MNVEPWSPLASPKAGKHRTSNVEHRIMYSTIYNKDKAKRLPHSTLDVERSMFKLLRLKLRQNLHITLKLHIQVRSSEMRLTRTVAPIA
jgi:hypothetical protein